MRYLCPRSLVLGLFATALLAPIAYADKDKDRGDKPKTAQEKSHSDKAPAKLVRLEVWKVKLSPDADAELIEKASQKLGNRDEAAARVKRLQAKGVVDRSVHMMVTGLEKNPIALSMGSRQPAVSGVSTNNFGLVRSIIFESVGTILRATTHVASESRLHIELSLEESYLAPSDVALFSPKEGKPVTAQEVRNDVYETTVACPSGGAVVVVATNHQNSQEASAELIYVAASLVE